VTDSVSKFDNNNSQWCVLYILLKGGAFGGKELRTFLITVPTALAAQRYIVSILF